MEAPPSFLDVKSSLATHFMLSKKLTSKKPKKILLKGFSDGLNHIPPLEKAKKQEEVPLPILQFIIYRWDGTKDV